jgi:hypothetical protein
MQGLVLYPGVWVAHKNSQTYKYWHISIGTQTERFRNNVVTIRTALFWVVTQRVVVIYYRRFGTTSRSHFFSTPMKTGPIGCPETSITNYQNMLRNNPEELSSHLQDYKKVSVHLMITIQKVTSNVQMLQCWYVPSNTTITIFWCFYLYI